MCMKPHETVAGATQGTRPAITSLLLVALLLAVALTVPAIAQEESAAPAAAPTLTPTQTPEATPDLGQALHAAINECRAKTRELSAAAKDANPQDAAALRAEAVAVRRALKRQLLEIQLEYAQRSGDAALVDELTGILQRLDQPAVGVPQNRPAPEQTPQPAPAAR